MADDTVILGNTTSVNSDSQFWTSQSGPFEAGWSFVLPTKTHSSKVTLHEIQAYEYVTALYQRSLVLCCSAVFSLFRLSSAMPASVFDFKVFILYFQGAVAVIIVISSPAVHGQRFYP